MSWLRLPALNPGPAIDAAGESHYQDALETVGGGRTCFGVRQPLITAELIREPANPYDPNAVRVEGDGHRLAYVPKEDAPASTPSSTSWPPRIAQRRAEPG